LGGLNKLKLLIRERLDPDLRWSRNWSIPSNLQSTFSEPRPHHAGCLHPQGRHLAHLEYSQNRKNLSERVEHLFCYERRNLLPLLLLRSHSLYLDGPK
jgi:hypothetical protein